MDNSMQDFMVISVASVAVLIAGVLIVAWARDRWRP